MFPKYLCLFPLTVHGQKSTYHSSKVRTPGRTEMSEWLKMFAFLHVTSS